MNRRGSHKQRYADLSDQEYIALQRLRDKAAENNIKIAFDGNCFKFFRLHAGKATYATKCDKFARVEKTLQELIGGVQEKPGGTFVNAKPYL